MRWSVLIPLALLSAPAAASVTTKATRDKPACEPFVDQREIRFRTPTASVTGRVVPGSIHEDAPEFPDAGQQLIFGTAELFVDAAETRRLFVNYAYWSGGGCGGWEPARGQPFRFDLSDDKSKDGSLRVMRFLSDAGPLR